MDCREFVKNAQAIGDVLWNLFNSALWQTFNQARPQCFRYSQDAQSARQLFCDRLQCCGVAVKYTRSRCALVEFSPSTPARLQVFSSRAVGPTTFLRLAAEQLKNTRAPDVLWSNFRQARPRRFRYSQDAKAAWQLFCDWLPSCCKIHTPTTSTASSVSFRLCVCCHGIFSVAASPGPVFFGRSSAG